MTHVGSFAPRARAQELSQVALLSVDSTVLKLGSLLFELLPLGAHMGEAELKTCCSLGSLGSQHAHRWEVEGENSAGEGSSNANV